MKFNPSDNNTNPIHIHGLFSIIPETPRCALLYEKKCKYINEINTISNPKNVPTRERFWWFKYDFKVVTSPAVETSMIMGPKITKKAYDDQSSIHKPLQVCKIIPVITADKLSTDPMTNQAIESRLLFCSIGVKSVGFSFIMSSLTQKNNL